MDRHGDRMELKDSLGQQVEAYTLHLPGKGKLHIGYMLSDLAEKNVKIDERITVITTATDDQIDRCPLIRQLNDSGVHYINSAADFDGEWKKTIKLPLILNALERVTTKYALILDANDVAILKDIDEGFINTWLRYETDVLFNGSQYLYPKGISARQEKVEESVFINHYLNAGVCFGYTDKLRSLYDTAYKFSQTENYYPIESEQYYIRIAMIENREVKVKIDDGSHLFLVSHGN